MKVSFVNMPIEYYSPVSGGAIATIIAQTARCLIASGDEVTVLTPIDGQCCYEIGDVKPLQFERKEEMSFVRGKLSGLRRRAYGWDWPGYDTYLAVVLHRLRDVQPDAVIVFNDLVTPKYIKRQLPESKVISWLQNEWRTNQRSLKEVINSTTWFVGCSQYIVEWTRRTHGLPRERMAVLSSGVDLRAFHPNVDSGERVRALRVLFVGRLDPNKGPDIVADAVRTLRAEGVDVSLTVAGAAWFYDRGDQLADPFIVDLTNTVREAGGQMLGHVPRDRLPDVYRGHDVVCVLSRSQEPFGLVALEAMASGCAVLSSNRGGLPEACGGAAVLVDPEDRLAVAAQLRRWATDPAALQKAKSASVRRASEASWSTVATRLKTLIESETL